MAIFVTIHASNVLAVVEIIAVVHLLYWLNTFGQKTTYSVMLTFALLAKSTTTSRTFANHMTPLVTLIAYCSLRAFVSRVKSRQTKKTTILIKACIVMMTNLFTSETSDIILKVSEH